jgi:hypothetical protein
VKDVEAVAMGKGGAVPRGQPAAATGGPPVVAAAHVAVPSAAEGGEVRPGSVVVDVADYYHDAADK